jgi:NAD+ diphosphatase
MVYHVLAHGQVQLSPELVDYRRYLPQDIKPWPLGTGLAVKHWQERRGIFNDFVKLGGGA